MVDALKREMVVSGSHRECGGPACSSAPSPSPLDTSHADRPGVSVPMSACVCVHGRQEQGELQ